MKRNTNNKNRLETVSLPFKNYEEIKKQRTQ